MVLGPLDPLFESFKGAPISYSNISDHFELSGNMVI